MGWQGPRLFNRLQVTHTVVTDLVLALSRPASFRSTVQVSGDGNCVVGHCGSHVDHERVVLIALCCSAHVVVLQSCSSFGSHLGLNSVS